MEFNIIYKNLEKETYNREEVKRIYLNECDFTLTTENSKHFGVILYYISVLV